MKFISLLTFCLFFTACKDLTGALSVAPGGLTLKHKTIFNNLKKKHIPAGEHHGKLTFESKTKAKLSLKIAGKSKNFKIQLPKGAEFPKHTGDFHFTAEELEQNFDLVGDITTTTEYGQSYVSTKSCSISTRERVCRRVCKENPRPNERKCRRVCNYETVYHTGIKDIEVHPSTTTQILNVNFQNPDAGNSLAAFGGRHVEFDSYSTDLSSCRLY